MTVQEFISNVPAEHQDKVKSIRTKAKETGILKEQVNELGNDLWLSQELNINRQKVEEIANPKKRLSC